MKPYLTFLLLIGLLNIGHAQLTPQNIHIPMRDGDSLAAHLYLPNLTDTFPTILIQTPYNKTLHRLTGLPLGIKYDLANSPYAFVVVDWRCFYGSLNACKLNIERGQDGYDAVEWIAAQAWSDGKIGTWGPSALGNIQYQTAREQPPHLVCAVPEVASPQTYYHQYYPGGVARTEYLETLGVLFGIDNLIAANPHYNLVWQIIENGSMFPDEIKIPMLLVGGWYDHNTDHNLLMLDTLRQASDPGIRDKHRILVGPWVHGGTGPARIGSEQQGELSYPEAAERNDSISTAFFDFHLRGIANNWDESPVVQYFQMGENTWQDAPTWPPAEAQYQSLWFQADFSLADTLPNAPASRALYSYDPEDPSPTVGGTTLSLNLDQGPYNQAPLVESRDDVLIFETPILTAPLIVKGSILADLSVSSDQPDTDFAIRITDVYPDGRSMLLASQIQRMRFRDGYRIADTSFMASEPIYSISLQLPATANTFLPGHQLRVIVSSSNYPRFNRNMNTGGEMYPNNNLDTLVSPRIATNTLHFNSTFPSRLQVPVVPASSTAIKPALPDATWSLFPNPTQGIVTLRRQGDRPFTGIISIYDLKGKLRKTQKLENFQAESVSFDINELPNGIWMIRIWDSAGHTFSRLISKQ